MKIKNQKSKIVLVLLSVLIFLSCKDNVDKPFLTLETTEVIFSAEQGSKLISFSSNSEISVTSSQPAWCSATVLADNGAKSIEITVQRNINATHGRAANITVSAGAATAAIEVKQDAAVMPTFFNIAAADRELQFSFAESQRDIVVNNNVDFTATSSAPVWCKAAVIENENVRSLRISVEQNGNNTSRTADITLSATGFEQIVIKVNQVGFLGVISGMTVYGLVSSNNVGLPGVVVSDGFEVTTTDDNGVYYLPSQKKHGYVFISIPGNYETPVVDNIPQFFQRLKANPTTPERIDFVLEPVNNDKHTVLVFGDIHLCNGTTFNSLINVPNILEQFNACVDDMNSVIAGYRTAGIKPYLLTLGDMTRDNRWYGVFPFDLQDYANAIKIFDAPVFNTIGNHDHDLQAEGEAGKQAWKNIIGPTYYSFNLGKAHYVVLDNYVWINNGGRPGVNGNGASHAAFTDYQLQWLRKDLETVADKTAPLIIAMHVPLYGRPNINDVANFAYMQSGHGQQLIDCLNIGFTNVLVLAGHTHPNSRHSPPAYPWLTAHHIAALGGNCFMTGQPGWANNHICTDGSPGGYGVYELDGKNVKWHYKGVGFDRNYQFRSYDRNRIHITWQKYAPNANATYQASAPDYAAPYHTQSFANDVIINVWGWETGWQIEVLEEGNNTPLIVTRTSTKDPLHIISYDFKSMNRNPSIMDLNTITDSHFFSVRAGSANSTLFIKVTDQFGNVYEETMTRPKELTYDMR